MEGRLVRGCRALGTRRRPRRSRLPAARAVQDRHRDDGGREQQSDHADRARVPAAGEPRPDPGNRRRAQHHGKRDRHGEHPPVAPGELGERQHTRHRAHRGHDQHCPERLPVGRSVDLGPQADDDQGEAGRRCHDAQRGPHGEPAALPGGQAREHQHTCAGDAGRRGQHAPLERAEVRHDERVDPECRVDGDRAAHDRQQRAPRPSDIRAAEALHHTDYRRSGRSRPRGKPPLPSTAQPPCGRIGPWHA